MQIAVDSDQGSAVLPIMRWQALESASRTHSEENQIIEESRRTLIEGLQNEYVWREVKED